MALPARLRTCPVCKMCDRRGQKSQCVVVGPGCVNRGRFGDSGPFSPGKPEEGYEVKKGGSIIMFILSFQMRIFTLLHGKCGTWSLKCSNLRVPCSLGTPPLCPHCLPPGDLLCLFVVKLCCFLEYRQVRGPERAQGAEDLAKGLDQVSSPSGPKLPHLL